MSARDVHVERVVTGVPRNGVYGTGIRGQVCTIEDGGLPVCPGQCPGWPGEAPRASPGRELPVQDHTSPGDCSLGHLLGPFWDTFLGHSGVFL